MAALVLYLLTLLMAGHSSASWCVCKTGLSDSVLQRTLDYACGNGADCNPTHPKGSCFNPDNVRAHCNYAVNSFFQKKGQASESCNFTGTATLTTTDPSYTGCAFPSSASGSSGSSSSSSTVTPGKNSPKGSSSSSINTFPGGNSNSPYTGTPTTGLLGGNVTDATGTGFNPDYSTESSSFTLHNSYSLLFTSLWSVVLMML
ncbi:PREDICTED: PLASMODESMATA CALLOSE-BINDING PROTEIN 2-like isoform X2 [Camelina sativa]|uniref:PLASMODESMATA CALLOSE-BINDING PROTEIN 2-like isoform X2 n=1 Tax=Camelina sativa TaxID=90675 RepID=A0ABM0TA42_CAMSA|nr:PREDICTED: PLASMODESMATA CALLOSE-BINDING PROTEIN 2-like isoform X2 [Camelina sativa]